jgi:DNA-binding response OmpR family regulator
MHVPQGYRALVIDDDPETLNLLESVLTREGFAVTVAADAHAGIRAAYRTHPDVILLDVMMPGLGGFEACRRLRQVTDASILFVTARAQLDDVMEGLSAGGDDYVLKPFRPPELVGRVRACLRRWQRSGESAAGILLAGEAVMLNHNRQELMVEGRVVRLTPREFEVLRLLVRHAGTILSRNAILTRVWGPQHIGDPDLVKHYIYRLREKIEPDAESPRYLHTVRGRGYFFDA